MVHETGLIGGVSGQCPEEIQKEYSLEYIRAKASSYFFCRKKMTIPSNLTRTFKIISFFLFLLTNHNFLCCMESLSAESQ